MTDFRVPGVAVVLTIFSWLLQVGGFVVGPIIVWRLYGRPFNRPALLGGLLGIPVAGAVVLALAMLAPAVDWFVGLFTDVQYLGAIGFLVLVVLAFIALIVWLDVNAIRDLSPSRRQHRGTDVARLLATVVIAIYVTIVAVVAIRVGDDTADAGVFMLLAGVQGAAVLAAADVVVRAAKLRGEAQATSHA